MTLRILTIVIFFNFKNIDKMKWQSTSDVDLNYYYLMILVQFKSTYLRTQFNQFCIKLFLST